jgi:hypothetical protein
MLGLPAYLTGNSKLVSVRHDSLTVTYWTADIIPFSMNILFMTFVGLKIKNLNPFSCEAGIAQ